MLVVLLSISDELSGIPNPAEYGVVVKTWIKKLNCISFLNNFEYHSYVLTIETINMLKHTVPSLKKQAEAQASSMYPPLISFKLYYSCNLIWLFLSGSQNQ